MNGKDIYQRYVQLFCRECGVASHVFAYPNGQTGDWSDETERILAEANFEGALTTLPGVNNRATPRMRLKRISLDGTDDWPTFIATESGLRGITREIKSKLMRYLGSKKRDVINRY